MYNFLEVSGSTGLGIISFLLVTVTNLSRGRILGPKFLEFSPLLFTVTSTNGFHSGGGGGGPAGRARAGGGGGLGEIEVLR